MMRVMTLGLFLALTPVATAADEGELGANAALHYWQAFAGLPRLDEAQGKKLAASLTVPLDDETRRWAQQSDDSFRELRHGAALPRCAWGVSLGDGFAAVLHHPQAARTLAHLTCLRVRQAFATDRPQEALDDAVATMTMARHLSADGTLISWLVGAAIEQQMYEVLAQHLRDLGTADRARLAQRIDRLPTGGPLAACLRTEETAGLDWFIARVKATKGAKDLQNVLALLHGEGGEEKAKKMLQDAGGTAQGVIRAAEEIRPIYGTFARKLTLPPDRFVREWNAEAERLKNNPVFALLAPALPKVRYADARLETRRAMWKAALAVVERGPEAGKERRDPFGDGPFTYETFEGGFILKAKMTTPDDKPLTLTVGRRTRP